MAIYIEVLTPEKKLVSSINSAIESLNKVQSEFIFGVANERLLTIAQSFNKEVYTIAEVFNWLLDYKKREKKENNFLVFVIDGFLTSENYTNLFGSHRAEKGLAVFTTHDFDHFLNDKVRFCRYYLLRYALSFIAPNIKSHDQTRDCMFDKKLNKKDLLLSLNSGKICTECGDKLREVVNPDINSAIEAMLLVVSNQYPYALVMKGGGIKGLAFAGALEELEPYFSFDVFAGTSAGSIAAALLGAGYKPKELLNILKTKNFNDFKDANLFKKIYNLIAKGALYPGAAFENWLDNLIKKKFAGLVSEIYMENLYSQTIAYASTVTSGTVTFDTNGENRNAVVSFAVRCSMSIPYYFIPKTLNGLKVYDGGLRNNFPLKMFMEFNQKKPFIGLYIRSRVKKNGWTISQLANIAIDGEERATVDKYRQHIVVIDTEPISTTDFGLTDEGKAFLVLTGRLAALKFMKEYYPDIGISDEKINQTNIELEEKRKGKLIN